jgi:hypothetical protein
MSDPNPEWYDWHDRYQMESGSHLVRRLAVADIETTIDATPSLLKPGATVKSILLRSSPLMTTHRPTTPTDCARRVGNREHGRQNPSHRVVNRRSTISLRRI